MDKPYVSIIMPALNEENNIRDAVLSTLNSLDALKINGEVVVVNDGSSDKTPDIVRALSSDNQGRVSLVNHNTPQGIGASFWDGLDNAKGEIAFMLPGDNENNPSETLRYLKLMEDVDIVIPFVFNKKVRSFARNILSRLYTFIINTSFGLSLNYTNGTVIYRKAILTDLPYRSKGFFYQADILIRLIKRGYLFAEVPYSLSERKSGKSKALTLKSLLKITRGYFNLLKDIYLSREIKLARFKFSPASISAKRYK